MVSPSITGLNTAAGSSSRRDESTWRETRLSSRGRDQRRLFAYYSSIGVRWQPLHSLVRLNYIYPSTLDDKIFLNYQSIHYPSLVASLSPTLTVCFQFHKAPHMRMHIIPTHLLNRQLSWPISTTRPPDSLAKIRPSFEACLLDSCCPRFPLMLIQLQPLFRGEMSIYRAEDYAQCSRLRKVNSEHKVKFLKPSLRLLSPYRLPGTDLASWDVLHRLVGRTGL